MYTKQVRLENKPLFDRIFLE